jgi:predicted membrane chloride channel (bestrophin family)
VQALVAPTALCLAQTLAIALYATYAPHSFLPVPYVPQEFFDLTGGALALLLVFRTDASYNRWEEARRQWGDYIVHGRNLVRHSLAMCDDDNDCGGDEGCDDAYAASPAHAASRAGALAQRREEREVLQCGLVRWTVAFGVLLKLHLRADGSPASLTRELRAWLSPDELLLLAASRHKPNAALQVLSRLARARPCSRADSVALDACLDGFAETLGRCERISRVPIPLAYTRHTSRFLIAWLALLPLGCWTTMGWAALLFAPLTAFLLFGVDQIGVDLENPFSMLPLDVLAHKLKLDATDMMLASGRVRELAAVAATQRASLAPPAATPLLRAQQLTLGAVADADVEVRCEEGEEGDGEEAACGGGKVLYEAAAAAAALRAGDAQAQAAQQQQGNA